MQQHVLAQLREVSGEGLYRHCFWDSGTILANLLAMTAAHRVPARVVCGFVDDRVNRLLGLEPQREVALALVPLGRNSAIGYAPAGDAAGAGDYALSRVGGRLRGDSGDARSLVPDGRGGGSGLARRSGCASACSAFGSAVPT